MLFIISNAFATNEKGEKELVHIIHLNIYDRHLKYITLLLVPNGGMVGVESEHEFHCREKDSKLLIFREQYSFNFREKFITECHFQIE